MKQQEREREQGVRPRHNILYHNSQVPNIIGHGNVDGMHQQGQVGINVHRRKCGKKIDFKEENVEALEPMKPNLKP